MKMRNKAVILLLAVFVLAICLPTLSACNGKEIDSLIVYNWADYIAPDVLDSFAEYYEEQTGNGLQITYSTYDTNENMLTTILKGDTAVDLLCPSEYAIQKLMENDALQKLDFSAIPNYANVYSPILTAIDATFGDLTINGNAVNMADYFVPYMWGTLGILYNVEMVTEQDIDTGWGILWNQAQNPDLEGKILVKDSIRDTYCAAVMYLKENDMLPAGYETLSVQQLINTVDGELLSAAEAVLTQQRSHLKGYEVDFGKDDMSTGVAYVDLAWSGDALWAIEESEEIELDYYVPEVGGNVWFDGWVIPKNAPNADIAAMFIDYMCDPEIAMANSMEIGYVNSIDPELLKANEGALALLEENEYDVDEYFEDIRRYPVVDETLGVMKDFGANNEAAVEMWLRVKTAGSGEDEGLGELAVPVYALVACIALVGILALAYFIVQRSKLRGKVV